MTSSNKRGVELTMNTVIVAVLVLLVLILLVFFLLGGFKSFQTGTGCTAHKGTCDPSGSCPTGKYLAAWSCPNNVGVCCTDSPLPT